jgi:predicted small lipoprotein YifL
MSRRVRATVTVAVLLAAFGALLGCGQRGPLTLPGSAQPIKRLDPSKAAPATPAPSGAPAASGVGADTPAAGTTPRPEDDERRTGE